jgi:predicted AlkP superfamily phosphohydrolase/phosphomutase
MAQTRLLVLGFESMDIELVRRWAEAGHLPTFRRLFEMSAWTRYVDPREHLTGTIWASINSGLNALQHNFYFPRRFCGGSYRMRLARAEDMKADPFWKWFAQSGRRIVLADVTHAVPKPEYGGKQFSGWGSHDVPLKRTSVPNGLLRDLSARFGDHPVPRCHNYSMETDSLTAFRSGLLMGIERRTAIFKSLLLCRDWDLFYGVYSEPHCAGHLLWHLDDDMHPKHAPDQFAALGHALRDVYAAIDRALAELLALADADTACAVFFSHGMGPNYHADHLFPKFITRFNRRWEGTGPGTERSDERRGWFDSMWRQSIGRTPEAWRMRVKQRVPVQLRARISILRDQNPGQWSRMPAFPLPFDVISSLRVNLAGREPRGHIRPGEEYRRYLDAFTEEVSRLINAETGDPAVERIWRADRSTDPLTMGSGPDLLVWWSKSSPIRAVRSSMLGMLSGELAYDHSGEHVTRGMLLISHPGAIPGCHPIEGMSGVDIPATLCDLAGIRPGGRLDGTSRMRDLIAG